MHVFGVPFGTDILDVLCKEILKNGLDFSEIAVVFPTQRNKLYFSHYLQENFQKEAFFLPYLYEIGEFIREATLSPYSGIIINNWQRNFFLKEAIKQTEAHSSSLFRNLLEETPQKNKENWLEDLFSFLEVGNRLLRFYDEILRERIDFTQLREQALYTDYEAHVQVLEKVWSTYVHLLRERSLIDPVVKETALQLDETFLSQFRTIYLVGPITMTKTEMAFFKLVAHRVPLFVFFQAEIKKPYPHQEAILKAWGKDPSEVIWLEGSQTRSEMQASLLINPTIKAFPNAVSQVGFILNAISESLKMGLEPHKIAIVLPDASLKNLLLSYLDERHLNLTMGLDLKHSLSYSLLYFFYELWATQTEYGYYHRPLLNLLTHPLFKGLIPGECQGYQERILKNNLIYISDQKGPIFRTISEIKGQLESERIDDLCLRITDFLQKLCLQGSLKPLLSHPHETMALKKMWEALEDLATLGRISPEKNDFLSLFRYILNYLGGLNYPLPGGIGGKIQVMEVLETRNLQFDVVIIPDMNEGLFPAKSEKDLFLNTAVRRALNLPTYKEREALYRYHFERLLKGARRAYLSYVASEERGVRSRFIEEIIYQKSLLYPDYEKEVEDYQAYTTIPAPLLRDQPWSQINDTSGKNKMKRRFKPAFLEERSISPSALFCYQVCPYKFYLRYILKLEPPIRVTERILPQDKGIVFHKVLKMLYKQRIWERGHKEFLEKLRQGLLEEFKKMPQFNQQPSAQLEIEILLTRLGRFIKNEYREFRQGWQPEVSLLETEIEVPYTIRDFTLILKGIPDRIDRKAGKFRIIDYKTGYIPSARACEIGENFLGVQLPFYLFLLYKKYGWDYENCEALGFYDLNNFEIKYHYKDFAKDPWGYMETYEHWLKKILTEILAKDTWERKQGDQCRFCEYQDMC